MGREERGNNSVSNEKNDSNRTNGAFDEEVRSPDKAKTSNKGEVATQSENAVSENREM